ncbi:MAG: hypothetical protein PHV21_05690 [Synergistaceae bacterium]|nr:hypothetical protein [Synergistaceae bacterium]
MSASSAEMSSGRSAETRIPFFVANLVLINGNEYKTIRLNVIVNI